MRLGGGRLGVGELNDIYKFYLCVFFLHNIERVHITYGYIFAYEIVGYFILFKYLILSNQYEIREI